MSRCAYSGLNFPLIWSRMIILSQLQCLLVGFDQNYTARYISEKNLRYTTLYINKYVGGDVMAAYTLYEDGYQTDRDRWGALLHPPEIGWYPHDCKYSYIAWAAQCGLSAPDSLDSITKSNQNSWRLPVSSSTHVCVYVI